jgi:hypothetical protein
MKFSEWLKTQPMNEEIWGSQNEIDDVSQILAQFHIDTIAQNQIATAIGVGLTKGMGASSSVQQASKLLTSSQMQLVNYIRNHK